MMLATHCAEWIKKAKSMNVRHRISINPPRAVGRIQGCDPPNEQKSKIHEAPAIVSLPTRLTRRSSRPASTFGVFSLAFPARAAERGRWAELFDTFGDVCERG